MQLGFYRPAEVWFKCPIFIYVLPGYGFKAEYFILLFNCPNSNTLTKKIATRKKTTGGRVKCKFWCTPTGTLELMESTRRGPVAIDRLTETERALLRERTNERDEKYRGRRRVGRGIARATRRRDGASTRLSRRCRANDANVFPGADERRRRSSGYAVDDGHDDGHEQRVAFFGHAGFESQR